MNNQCSMRCCLLLRLVGQAPPLHPLPWLITIAPCTVAPPQQTKVMYNPGKDTAEPWKQFPLGNTSSLPTKHASPCSKAITDTWSCDYQFCFSNAEGKHLAAGGGGRFQDLIQHLLVKLWTGIVSLGEARDVEITLAGWFHPPAIGYPARQNDVCLI